MNIGGWYITDTPYNPTFIQLPANQPILTTIPAKGYLVLWADDQPEQGALHLNFKLSKDGEKLVLSRYNYLNNLVVVDSVSVPALTQNLSFSRVPDGSSIWTIKSMTCNYSNSFGADVPSTIENEIRVYPSLVSDMIVVENAMGENIEIYDLSGHKVFSSRSENNRETISAGHLQKGIYILTTGSYKTKIVKM